MEGRCNSKGRKRWWGGEGRTLEFVLDYIAVGNEPRLTMPPRQAPTPRRHFTSWLPRRMGTASSSSSSGPLSSGSPHTPTLARVKPEPEDTPRGVVLNSGRRIRSPPRRPSGGIRINDRRVPSPPRGHLRLVRPKKEPGTGGATSKKKKAAVEWVAPPEYVRAAINAEAPDDDEEFPGEQNAVTASMQDVAPPMVAAEERSDEFIFEWSRNQHAQEEIALQQRLLDEAAANRRRAAARRPPTPPRQASGEVIVLDDDGAWFGGGANNNEASPSHFGGGAPPSDDDDDGGEYTAFYSQLGM